MTGCFRLRPASFRGSADSDYGPGTKAFETQEWEEADSLLQEALQVLQQLPKRQRAFCDVFDLHYRLAVCSYHTQAPVDAEEALMSLVQQSASSDRQREYIYNATHLLSHLYIRMGQLENARMECEKALQARRRLLGKQSDASLESTALMVHIYVLLNNRARAKSYLAMIPEIRRDAIVKGVEESLGTKLEDIELQSPLTRSISDMSDLAITRSQSRTSAASPQLPMEDYCFGPVSSRMSQLPTARLRQSHQSITSTQADSEHLRSTTVTSLSSLRSRSGSRTTDKERASEAYSTYPEAVDATLYPLRSPLDEGAAFKGKTLSRKEVLDKIGCQPKDGIEDAVCDGDHPAFANLLSSKKVSWKSKLRKHVRSERVTALHFAAVFGEVEMARRLLGANFNINETPYGYSTSLTPMKFAIGARQVTMVEFLVANGARPSGSDSWSTLAGQLMNRSWLNKTMSEADKDIVPTQMIAILKILIKHGWHMNAPFETAGGTVLHQAVSFWTGSYKWDLHLRTAMTSFLCEIGANPRQSNREGKTPYDMASASGHQDLLMILDRAAKKKPSMDEPVKPD